MQLLGFIFTVATALLGVQSLQAGVTESTKAAQVYFPPTTAYLVNITRDDDLQKHDYSHITETEVLELWDWYKGQFNKKYATKAESELRLNAFRQSLARISHQNKIDTAVYGLTKFSDMTLEDFWSTWLMQKHGNEIVNRDTEALRAKYSSESGARYYKSHFNDDCDWRVPSSCNSTIPFAVTSIKNQNECGGCWAYAAIETLESRFMMDGNNLTTLSVSQILDCDTGSKY